MKLISWYCDIHTRRRTALLCCGTTKRLEIKPKRSFQWRTKNAVLWWWTWSTRCSRSSFDSVLFWPSWVDLYRCRNRNFHELALFKYFEYILVPQRDRIHLESSTSIFFFLISLLWLAVMWGSSWLHKIVWQHQIAKCSLCEVLLPNAVALQIATMSPIDCAKLHVQSH